MARPECDMPLVFWTDVGRYLWQLQIIGSATIIHVYAFSRWVSKSSCILQAEKKPPKKKKSNYCQTIAYSAGPRCFSLPWWGGFFALPPWVGWWAFFFTFFFVLFIHSRLIIVSWVPSNLTSLPSYVIYCIYLFNTEAFCLFWQIVPFQPKTQKPVVVVVVVVVCLLWLQLFQQ